MSLMKKDDWLLAVANHRRRIMPWANDRRQRGSLGSKHPVYDFLFDYYSFRPSQLLRWTPGFGVLLEQATAGSFEGAHEFDLCDRGLILRAERFPAHRRPYLNWALHYLQRISERPPHLGCFGLHEWAMVYGDERPRHESVPLRLSRRDINQCCESLGLRCTHYDAYRFFTVAAQPLNALPLSREATPRHDQPACVHVTMDLYKFSYKIAPFSSSAIVADTFELALAAREIDMRASPYDLLPFGLEPIAIETPEGRKQYTALQRDLFERSVPLRERLIAEYHQLRTALELSAPRIPEAATQDETFCEGTRYT